MPRRRDPTPFGSRERDTPDYPAFMLIDSVSPLRWTELAGRGKLKPEFFKMLREFRFTRIRLVIEAVTLLAGVAMLFVLPTLALAILLIAVVAGIFDLVVFLHLRRRIAQTWEDLSAESR